MLLYQQNFLQNAKKKVEFITVLYLMVSIVGDIYSRSETHFMKPILISFP